jgi:hypothetical protein
MVIKIHQLSVPFDCTPFDLAQDRQDKRFPLSEFSLVISKTKLTPLELRRQFVLFCLEAVYFVRNDLYLPEGKEYLLIPEFTKYPLSVREISGNFQQKITMRLE